MPAQVSYITFDLFFVQKMEEKKSRALMRNPDAPARPVRQSIQVARPVPQPKPVAPVEPFKLGMWEKELILFCLFIWCTSMLLLAVFSVRFGGLVVLLTRHAFFTNNVEREAKI